MSHGAQELAPSPKATGAFGRVLDVLTSYSAILAGWGMFFIAVINFYEIIMRTFFEAPSEWVLDFSIYGLIWFGFMAAANAQRQGSNVQVDIFTHSLAPNPKALMELWNKIVMLVYVAVLVGFGTVIVLRSLKTGQLSASTLQTPMWIVQLAIPLGAAFLGLELIRELWDEGKHALSIRKEFKAKDFVPVFIMTVLVVACLVLIPYNKIWCAVALLFVMLLGGVPVFAALGMTGTLGFFMVLGGFNSLIQIPFIGFKALNDFVLLAVPLFILCGALLESGGLGEELFDFCFKWVGHLPGGLAVATVFACSIFAAISGSSVATAATIGAIAIPAMLARGYTKDMAMGIVAVAGTLGILIPPSNPMILYSSITNESTGALFMAGIGPGILLSLCLAGYIVFRSIRERQGRIPAFSWKDRLAATQKGIWSLLAPIIILVGIYAGIFTPTEAAAVVVVYAFIVNLCRQKPTLAQVNNSLADCTKSGGMILMIIVGAIVMGAVFTQLRVPQLLAAWVIESGFTPAMVVIMTMLLMMVLGTMLEVVSIILITIPIIYPLIKSMGLDGVWYCILVVVNMELALISPPVGLNLYVVAGLMKGTTMMEVIRSVIPYIIILVLFLILIALVPDIILWLPKTMRAGV